MEKQISIYDSIRSTLKNRVKEFRKRIELGKSRESELLSIESQIAALEGDLENSRGLALVARDLLGFLWGMR